MAMAIDQMNRPLFPPPPEPSFCPEFDISKKSAIFILRFCPGRDNGFVTRELSRPDCLEFVLFGRLIVIGGPEACDVTEVS